MPMCSSSLRNVCGGLGAILPGLPMMTSLFAVITSPGDIGMPSARLLATLWRVSAM